MARPEENGTWVTVDTAAKTVTKSPRTIAAAAAKGIVPSRGSGHERQVQLEAVLDRYLHQDLRDLRRRLDQAADTKGIPDVTRQHWQSMRDTIFPLLDRLESAERRAALAEVRLGLTTS